MYAFARSVDIAAAEEAQQGIDVGGKVCRDSKGTVLAGRAGARNGGGVAGGDVAGGDMGVAPNGRSPEAMKGLHVTGLARATRRTNRLWARQTNDAGIQIWADGARRGAAGEFKSVGGT